MAILLLQSDPEAIPISHQRGVRIHDDVIEYQCRHTFASALLTGSNGQPGESPYYVADQLGHVDVQMVFRIYGKFIAEDYKRQQARPMLRVVSGL